MHIVELQGQGYLGVAKGRPVVATSVADARTFDTLTQAKNAIARTQSKHPDFDMSRARPIVAKRA